VSWRDPACFLRCGDGLDVSNRVVQIFLPEYFSENCFEKIKGKCVLARGIQENNTHAPGTLFQDSLPGCITSKDQKQLYLFPETADADDSSVMLTQSPPPNYAIEYAAKIRLFGRLFSAIFHRVLTSASAVYRAPHFQKHTSSRMA